MGDGGFGRVLRRREGGKGGGKGGLFMIFMYY